MTPAATAATFDLVAVPSALVDRRTLSQAWYDALHLAERNPPRSASRPHPADSSGIAQVRPNNGGARNLAPARANRAARHLAGAHLADPRSCGRLSGRRAAPTRLARRIVAEALREPARAGFALRTSAGRVYVCIQRERGALRLIALCAPAARTAVDRALAHARFALAAQGLRTV